MLEKVLGGGAVVSALVGLIAAAGLSSCSTDAGPSELERLRTPIIGGAPDPGESGVVLITHRDFPFICSGTVVHPTLVVTAKHCTFRERDGANNDEPMAGDRFRVGFGPALGQLTFRDTARMEWIGMPDNVEVDPAVMGGEDIALLYLASGVPAGTRIHDIKLDYFPAGGDTITIVGYGRSSTTSQASGVKLVTNDAFDVFDPTTGIIATQGKGACFGDSGGAFFFGAGREWVAVTSATTSENCDGGQTLGTSVRNTAVNQFLSDALAGLGLCSPQPEICGDNLDQDCDNIPDNGCTPDGAACTNDIECANGVCASIGGNPVCARLCDDLTKCPASMRCSTACGAGYCEAGAQGTSTLLASCANGGECTTNHCGSSGCTLVCRPNFGECPDDMACAAAGACSECAPVAGVPGPRQLGESCTSSSDCEVEAECIDDGFGVKRCATGCFALGSCPGGFSCRNDRCVRAGGLSNGERCFDPADCGSFLCALFPADPRENFCTRPCVNSGDCGIGFDCVEQFGQMVCSPDGKRLGEDCTADSECSNRTCDPQTGKCTRQCDPKSAPCPPGFLCEVRNGELGCVAGPDAFTNPVQMPEAGTGGMTATGGATAAGGGSGAGAGGGTAGGPVDDDGPTPPTKSGGGCSAAPQQSHGPVWALALSLLLLRRRRR